MRRFRYKLQAAYDRFCDAEKAAERAAAAAQARLSAEWSGLAAIEAKAGVARELLRTAESVFALSAIDRRLAALEAAERERRVRIAEAQRCHVQARTELQRVARRRDAMARHRARALAQHFNEAQLREAAELDEFNVLGTSLA